MTKFTFDTHVAVKTLRKAGFEEAQAGAVVATVGGAMCENVEPKANIQALKAAIQTLEQRMTAYISPAGSRRCIAICGPWLLVSSPSPRASCCCKRPEFYDVSA